MSALRNFILRFFIVFSPMTLSALIFVNFQSFSKLELALSSFLIPGIPWLLYEILQRVDHQRTANKAMLGFCSSMERVFTSMTSLEESTQKAPKEMISELRMLQNIMQTLVQEKRKTTVKKQAVGGQNAVGLETQPSSSPSPSSLTQEKGFPQHSADVIDIQGPDYPQSPITEDKTTAPLSRENLLEIIETALNSDSIEMLIQPIVSLPQRKARHFECFARIREKDGTIYTPDHFLHLAEEENLIRLVDNAMLLRCIQMTRSSVQKKFNVNFFCNMSQHTLLDKFFFEGLLEFLHSNRDLARHMIFEFHEKSIADHLDDMEPFLHKLGLYNCRFSIDQVTNLAIDVKRLKKLNVKYIKFHSDVLVRAIALDSGHKQVADFKKECNQHDIDVIISHVEDEKVLRELNDFNFDYGQGFLFGSPVLSKH